MQAVLEFGLGLSVIVTFSVIFGLNRDQTGMSWKQGIIMRIRWGRNDGDSRLGGSLTVQDVDFLVNPLNA